MPIAVVHLSQVEYDALLKADATAAERTAALEARIAALEAPQPPVDPPPVDPPVDPPIDPPPVVVDPPPVIDPPADPPPVVDPPVDPPPPIVIPPGDHGYFEAIRRRADCFHAYSLRDAAQIAQFRSGPVSDVSYDPLHDAARIEIPPYRFAASMTLQQALSPTDTQLFINGKKGSNVTYQVDEELLLWQSDVKDATGKTVIATNVVRGHGGTIPASHAAGTSIGYSSNSLVGQIGLPMDTEDGHSFTTIWEARYDASLRRVDPVTGALRSGLTTWKTYQFGRGKDIPSSQGATGFEVRTRFDVKGLAADEIGIVDVRAYMGVGPNVTLSADGLGPMLATFKLRQDEWVRYVLRITYVPGALPHGYDLVDLWMMSASQPPVQILSGAQVDEIQNDLDAFWLEFNTSSDAVVPFRAPLVAHVRNVVMLRDVADVTPLLSQESL